MSVLIKRKHWLIEQDRHPTHLQVNVLDQLFFLHENILCKLFILNKPGPLNMCFSPMQKSTTEASMNLCAELSGTVKRTIS